jgi:hypothetical protein
VSRCLRCGLRVRDGSLFVRKRRNKPFLFPAVEQFVGLVPRVLNLDFEDFLLELVLV